MNFRVIKRIAFSLLIFGAEVGPAEPLPIFAAPQSNDNWLAANHSIRIPFDNRLNQALYISGASALGLVGRDSTLLPIGSSPLPDLRLRDGGLRFVMSDQDLRVSQSRPNGLDFADGRACRQGRNLPRRV